MKGNAIPIPAVCVYNNKRFDGGAVFGGSRTKRAKARKCGLGPGPLRPVCFRKGMLKQCPNFQSRSENWQSS